METEDLTDKGLTIDELRELLKYIQENHSWEEAYDNHKAGRKIIKYVNFSLDTRTGDIWSITLDDKHLRADYGYILKDEVYGYLNHKDKEEIYEVKTQKERPLETLVSGAEWWSD